MLPEKYLESDVQYEVPYTKTIDFETNLENDDRTDANLITELRTKANIYLQENKVPKISYTVKSDINDKMEIGDTIQILHPLLSIKTEVLEYEYDNILGKVKSITFGNFTRSIKNKFDNIKTTLNKISNVVSNQEIVINRQTDLINSLNKNGYVYIDDNEILILDRLPKEQATNVWRWGLGGLGFSSHGYEGPFETAITMDGQINANFITTGQLSVSRIEGLANTLNEHSQNIANIELDINGITNTVSSVETKVNNMQIGGTNLLRGTNTVTALTSPGTWARGTWRQAGTGTGTRTSINVSDSPNANIKVGWSTASTSGQVLICQDNVPTTAGEVYTISCYAKGTGKIKLQYGNNSVGYLGVDRTIEDANTWKKYTYTITSRGTANVYFGSETQGNDVSFCGMKLEKGNVATDWAPAPEDIESNLESNYYTKTETESKIEQKADSITSTVSQNYSTKAETTQAKNEAIDSANTATDNKLENYSTTTQMNSAITQKANEITTTVTTLENKVNNMQVGGRNYLKNSKASVTLTKPASNYKQYNWDSYHPLATKTLSTSLTCTLSFRFIPTDENYRPCTSIVVGKNANGDIWSKRIYYSDLKVKKYSDYYFYYASFTIPATEGAYIQSFIKFILSSSDSANLGGQVSHLKLEDGNMPTDWTPAPEDIDSNLTTNYYTKTETETKINQKADEISSTVSSVSTKLNNLQIGGTNLLRGTNIVTSLGSSSAWTSGTWRRAGGGTGTRTSISVSDAPNANIKVGWSTTSTSGQVLISQDNVPMTNGEQYTISCYAKGTGKIYMQYGNGTVGYLGSVGDKYNITDSNNWKKFSYTFTSKGTANIYIGSDSAGNDVSFCGIKLEKGNIATDWSPAPEDIDSNLTTNYYTKTETETKINQKADEISSTVSSVSTKLNNLQIGGTNLLRGTNIVTSLGSSSAWTSGTWRRAGGGTGTRTSISVSDAPNANIKVGWSTTSTSGQVLISQDNVPMTNGEQYTISCYAKGTGKIYMQYGNGTVGYLGSVGDKYNITDSNNWKKFSYTFTSKGTANIYIGSDSAGNDVSFCGMKLEKGNMATDWSPAPEDIESNLITNYYTKTETETKIDQKADNITSTVNRTISNIQTGTENLLLNTAIKENTNNWTLASGITRTTSKTTPNGNYCFYYNISGLTSNSWRCANPAYVSVQPGEILTADVNVFIPSSNDIDGEVALEIQYFNSSRTRIGYLKKLIDTTVVDKWQKATVTLEAPTNAAYANARVWVLKNGKFYVGDLILSRGNTSASWAPSSNDYTAKTELGTLIEQNWEHIKVAWNQISQYLQLEGTNGSASLNIYNQSNNKLMTLNANGETYYNGSGNEIGKIGIIRQNNKDILAFSMPVDWNNISSSRSMAWGIFDPNNNFLPIFYLAGLYGANNSEYEGQLVVAGGLSAQDIELEQGIIKASIGGFQVLNNNDQVMLSVLKNGSGSSTYFNLLDLISTWYNTTVGCHYLDFHNNRLANLGNVPVSETNDPNLIKVINNIGGFDDSYIYASFKNGGDVFVYSNSSDRNLKKNIKETNISAIELIQKINHVQFDWKSNERHQSIGYIAQEMQEVEESFVHHSKYKDKEDWQINTLSVLATATKAIQEQQEIIEDLKSRIEKLEKKVNK